MIYTDNGSRAPRMGRTKLFRETPAGGWEWLYSTEFDGPAPRWYHCHAAPDMNCLEPVEISFTAPRAYRDCDVVVEFNDTTNEQWRLSISSDDPASFALGSDETMHARSCDAFHAAKSRFGVFITEFEAAS